MIKKDGVIMPLIEEARKIKASTNQMKVCTLLAKVVGVKDIHPDCKDLLSDLQRALSNALKGKYNEDQNWVATLNAELDRISNKI